MMTDEALTCPKCHGHNIGGVQYSHDCPYHWDGVSEWHCLDCHTRWGRWSNKILKDGQIERRLGGLVKRKRI